MGGSSTDLERLRRALREGGDVDSAAAPIIARHFENLLDYCERLVRSQRRGVSAPVEGVDLVSDAWLVALRRLAEPGSEEREICDEEHLIRLLKRVAQTRFFDALDRQHGRSELELDAPLSVRESAEGGMTLGESLPATETAEGLLFFGEKGRALPLVQALFESEEAFRARCVQPPRRRMRQYQAFVLHCLAEYFQREVGTSYGEEAALLRRYIHLLGVTPEQWQPIEDAALDEAGGQAALQEAIQAACGASVKDRATWSVLRYELNQLS